MTAERRLDALVHLLGTILAPVGAGLLIALAATPLAWLAAGVYGFGLIAMVGLSMAYNLARDTGRREILRRLDHAAIFVMIAGTYTPFALVALEGWVGAALLALVWTVALGGAAMKLAAPRRFERLSLVLYVGLGWVGLIAIGPLVAAVPLASLILIGVGGLCYTGGVAFHLWSTLPYQNAIWHAWVLAGAGCHYAAVVMVLT